MSEYLWALVEASVAVLIGLSLSALLDADPGIMLGCMALFTAVQARRAA